MTSSPEPERRPSPSTVAAWERVRRVLSLAWVPLTASLVSLVLSVGSIVIATRDPSVVLILPDQVRLAQGEAAGGAIAYLQATLVSTGTNDRVEVIRDLRLLVTPPAGGESAEFAWDETGSFLFDAETQRLSYEYVSDAGPLLITPREAQNPLALFLAPSDWTFEPGTYEMRLVADRIVASDALEATFQLELSAEDVEFLNESGGSEFLTIPIEPDGD
jgi:hypothetical protein